MNDIQLTRLQKFITVQTGKGWRGFLEDIMDRNHLKQLLAGLCISSLVSGAVLISGCNPQGSGA